MKKLPNPPPPFPKRPKPKSKNIDTCVCPECGLEGDRSEFDHYNYYNPYGPGSTSEQVVTPCTIKIGNYEIEGSWSLDITRDIPEALDYHSIIPKNDTVAWSGSFIVTERLKGVKKKSRKYIKLTNQEYLYLGYVVIENIVGEKTSQFVYTFTGDGIIQCKLQQDVNEK